MRCPSCDHENREGATYCEACGTALARLCSGCSVELRPSARFCDSCGGAVAEAEAAEGEEPLAEGATPEDGEKAAGDEKSDEKSGE